MQKKNISAIGEAKVLPINQETRNQLEIADLKHSPSSPKSEVAQLFAEEGVVLVHSSSKVRMFGANKATPLGRLENALKSRCDLPASTIKIGDTCDRRQYLGHLGLILDPVLFDNISVSWHEDAGSYEDPTTGKRRSAFGFGHNSPDQVERAVSKRGTYGVKTQYNEICCFDFKVVGLFADTEQPIFEMKAPLPGAAVDDTEIQAWIDEGGMKVGWDKSYQYQIDAVGARFPDLPLFIWQSHTGTFEVRIFDKDSGTYKANGEPPVGISNVYDFMNRF